MLMHFFSKLDQHSIVLPIFNINNEFIINPFLDCLFVIVVLLPYYT